MVTTSPAFTTASPSSTPLGFLIAEIRRKESEDKIASLTESLKSDPSNADALAQRGYQYSLIADYERAAADYQAALKLRPDDRTTQVRLESAKALLAIQAIESKASPSGSPSPSNDFANHLIPEDADSSPSVHAPESTPVPIPILANQVQRAVVRIVGLAGDNLVASGTGFFISSRGDVVTCWHVISNPEIQQLKVLRSDGVECRVNGVIAFSPKDDLALLRADTGADAAFLPVRSATTAKPANGTRVLLYANPGQLRGVWAEGAISGFIFGQDGFGGRDSLRFDAPVAPGSSGSPLVDSNKGDVIGVAKAAGWMLGNLAVPFYYLEELVTGSATTGAPIAFADFKAKLEKERPSARQRIVETANGGDVKGAAKMCDDYCARYPGDIWGTWEHVQLSFAAEEYQTAHFYALLLVPAKDPGDDLLCAIQHETAETAPASWNTRDWQKERASLLRTDYQVDICAVLRPAGAQLNVRERADAASNVLYRFDPDERVYAKRDRVRNAGGKENVVWRKVLLLPTSDRPHGGEGWVNERYLRATDAP